ncbi:MAG: UDP-N-acetylmuramoyl-L-alanyl-D-glutamate--2,6-diaminopimelate ligase [Bacteroidetes bacterium]|nr:UDP-N-acetylmuramoyl-L-alanyl-D-glutamate--2,6-diaminopimelate ligase [Bacteroidota bacterium]
MNLAEILNSVKVLQVTGQPERKEIEKLILDSRAVEPNSLFFAISGFKMDGHKFIESAINKGAIAVVLENNEVLPDEYFRVNGVVKILVEDSRQALAEMSAAFYGLPSEKLIMIGVTGTKGKTTTTFCLKHLLKSVYGSAGLLGTITNSVGDTEYKSKLTTPQSHEINSFLRSMVNKGIKHCAMEVSSHGLALKRVHKLRFNVGVFMNLTSDHMDYHETAENYLKSKKILFDMLDENSFAVFNLDDPNGENIVADTKAKKVSFGKFESADFRISKIEYDITGTRFCIIYKDSEFKVSTKLIGEFNAYNLTAAFACGVLLGVEPTKVAKVISGVPQIPGRMEVINRDDKYVLVDYSHTSDSLKQALGALQHIVHGERPIYTVFGCGGDRDKTKRPVMGKIATEMSDYAILTSDNPRTEDPLEIIEDVKKGIGVDTYSVNADREEAIKSAVLESPGNAVVLIAGKGHEDYQEVNGVRTHFSDKEIVEKYLHA